MATTINTRPTNGVSFGTKYVVQAADTGSAELIFDFGVDYDIVANIMVTDASGVFQPLTDAVITYPEAGQVSIADGSTFALAENNVVHVIAQRERS